MSGTVAVSAAMTGEHCKGIRGQTELTFWNFERQGEAVLMRKGQFRLVTNFSGRQTAFDFHSRADEKCGTRS
jgi:hypothetical protein